MSEAQNRATVEKFLSTVDAQQWDAVYELVAPACRARFAGQDLDREGWRQFGMGLYAGFPDGRHDVHEILATGDRVVVIATFRGTHRGEVFGVPATGKTVAFRVIHVDRVVDGRIVEHLAELDASGLLAQLGAMPAPAAGPSIPEQMLSACEAQDWDRCSALVSPDVRAHIGAQTMGRDEWMGFGKMFMAAFPDGRHDYALVLHAGEHVITAATFSGTHTGAFMGLPPTGKRIAFPVIHIDRVVDGTIVEHRGEFDSAILMRQLGLLPG
jgi:steroid delta-isomerase-like uncharacterized protein